MRKRVYSLMVTLALGGVALHALADGQRDHDRARAALNAGEILPLATILERVATVQPGQVLEVELEQDHGSWIYELKLIQSSGALVKLKVDARDGTVRKQKAESR
ncbi:MAG: PepSY domain-containing protein [Burkholderiaceae bacterium]